MMYYSEDVKKALTLSFEAHKDQKDKSGIPYVYHPFHLAEQMDTEEEVIVALLHDVVEDTDYTLEDIKAQGFGDEIIEALRLMTHDKSVPYLKYVEKIKTNPIATAVKIADLKHNSDLTRLDDVTGKDIERVQKYSKALEILTGKKTKLCNLNMLFFANEYGFLTGDICNGCFEMEYREDGTIDEDIDYVKKYKFSPEETVKLFNTITLWDFDDLCNKNGIKGVEKFLSENNIS